MSTAERTIFGQYRQRLLAAVEKEHRDHNDVPQSQLDPRHRQRRGDLVFQDEQN